MRSRLGAAFQSRIGMFRFWLLVGSAKKKSLINDSSLGNDLISLVTFFWLNFTDSITFNFQF